MASTLIQIKSYLKKNNENSLKSFEEDDPGLNNEPNPSPLDFVEFLPWACLNFQSPNNVTVTKLIIQEELPRKSKKSPRSTLCSIDSAGSTKSKISQPIKINQTVQDSVAEDVKDKDQKKEDIKTNLKSDKSTRTPLCRLSFDNFFTTEPGEKIMEKKNMPVPIIAHYNSRNNLIAVSIERCRIKINRIIIQVLGMCAPYHTSLHKLTIRKGGLTSIVLYEIGKLLPNSHLTHICLDDTFVQEANYYVLLEEVSKLKTLSLNRCFINDLVCQKLATNLDFGKPGSRLRTLELGSNQITDIGAKALGNILRRNRSLLHLNLSGNMVTDLGAFTILDHLMEFPLKLNEVLDMKRWQLTSVQQQSNYSMLNLPSLKIVNYMSTPKKNMPQILPATETMQNFESQLGGGANKKIVYPFDFEQVVVRNSINYCIGNMFLCSLNLAYNSLSYVSVRKAHQVLRYQSQLSKPASSIGLIRIVLNGNNMPKDCSDYIEMEKYLNKTIGDQTPTSCVLRVKKSLRNKLAPRVISFENK